MLLRRAVFLLLIFSIVTSSSLRSLTTQQSSSILLPIVILILLCLCGIIYYDRRNGYRWVTKVRHAIGELIRKTRQYRKKNGEKSMRIETEEVLPTPKHTQITEADNERPFIEQAHSVIQESNPVFPDPVAQEQLTQQRKEVDLKYVFQEKESKAKVSGKTKKEKKSKSKLKSRLQNQGTSENDEKEHEQQNSFHDEESVEEVPRGTEVE